MDINLITDFIANLGFPIFICVYLLRSNEKLRESLDNNTRMIDSLKSLIVQHNIKEEKE